MPSITTSSITNSSTTTGSSGGSSIFTLSFYKKNKTSRFSRKLFKPATSLFINRHSFKPSSSRQQQQQKQSFEQSQHEEEQHETRNPSENYDDRQQQQQRRRRSSVTSTNNNNADDDNDARIIQLTTMGNNYFSEKKYDNAMKMYAEVLRIAVTSHYSSKQQQDNDNNDDDDDNDNKLQRQRQRRRKKYSQKSTAARILINIGAVHLQRNETDDAMKAFQNALSLSQSISSKLHANNNNNDDNRRRRRRSDIDNTNEEDHDASSSSEEQQQHNDDRFIIDSITADVLQNIGIVHLKKNQYDDALESFESALSFRWDLVNDCRQRQKRQRRRQRRRKKKGTDPTTTVTNNNKNDNDNNNGDDDYCTTTSSSVDPLSPVVVGTTTTLSDALYDVAGAYKSMGLVNERLGRYRKCINDYEKSLEANREAYNNNLASCHRRQSHDGLSDDDDGGGGEKKKGTEEEEDDDDCCDLLFKIATVHAELGGNYPAAMEMFERVLHLRRQQQQQQQQRQDDKGDDDDRGDNDETDDNQNQQQQQQQRQWKQGCNNIKICETLNSLAGVHFRMGHFDEAMSLSNEAIEVIGDAAEEDRREKEEDQSSGGGGDHHVDEERGINRKDARDLILASALNNKGMVHERLGRIDDAMKCYRKTLRIKTSVLGSEHPQLGSTLHNIANVYHDLGKYDESIMVYKEALRIKTVAVTAASSTTTTIPSPSSSSPNIIATTPIPTHPSVAVTLNNIGTVHTWKGDYHRALKYHYKSLSVWKATVGDGHPSVAETLNNIGVVLKKLKRYEESMKCFTDALKIFREAGLGVEHPGVSGTIRNIADFEHVVGMERGGVD